MATYDKKGYLYQHFRIFHLYDSSLKPIAFHYHDFHKIILFLSGQASYLIEGKTYPLQPRDILFVSAGEIHRPITVPGASYERIVIYIAPDFLSHWSQDHQDLSQCFRVAHETSSVMHAPVGKSHDLLFHMNKLEQVAHQQGYANELYVEILFIEFLILLNRSLLDKELQQLSTASYDNRIQKVLFYINQHLTEPLPIDQLLDVAHMSKFHLMRKFKTDTGYSIHQYINSKRLLLAKNLLATTKLSVTDICFQCGFGDYSSFAREFKKNLQLTPKQFRQQQK